MTCRIWLRVGLSCVVGIILLGAGGCRGKAPAQQGMPPVGVIVTPAVVKDVPIYLDEIGRTTSDAVVMVAPQVSGIILSQDFKDGSDVTAGQILYHIDPRPFQAALDSAEATIKQSQAKKLLADQELKRAQDLMATKAISKEEFENRQNAVLVAETDVAVSVAARDAARLNVEYCTIRSPIEGRAGKTLVNAGNVVKMNEAQLVSIEKSRPIWVDFSVPESELPRVRKYQMQGKPLRVEVTLGDGSNQISSGELLFVDNTVQANSGVITLRAKLPNKKHQLWPGQFVRARLILATIEKAVLVPTVAIQIAQQGKFVYVIAPNPKGPGMLAEMHPVVVGQPQGDLTVIDQGVGGSDQVVIDGLTMLSPMAPVMPQLAPPAPAATQPTTEPAATDEATTEPADADSATTQPASTQPASTQPASTQPASTQSSMAQPAMAPDSMQPASTEPTNNPK